MEEVEELRRLVEFYESTLLNKYFPNFNAKENNEGMWSYDEDVRNTPLPSLYYNRNLYGSPYYLDKSTDFIHYTSLDAAFNIVKTNQIRLNELTQVNDPKEINFIKGILGEINFGALDIYVHDEFEDNASKSIIQRLKEKIYTISLCLIEDKENPDSFEMWKQYGDYGKGVAIVLNIDQIHRHDWYNFHLTQVYYGENETTDELSNFMREHQQFLIDNNVSFNDFDLFLAPMLSAHKSNYYQSEKEVRLLAKLSVYYNTDGINEDFNNILGADLNLYRNNMFRRCINLNLRNQYDLKKYKYLSNVNIPSISIEKIILGYTYDDTFARKLEGIINGINRKNNGPLIKVEVSTLKEELGF